MRPQMPKVTTGGKLALAALMLALGLPAVAAPKKLAPNTFEYDAGLTAYLNTKAGRANIPANLISIFCVESHEFELVKEHSCDVTLQGKDRTHRYVVKVPNGLEGRLHPVLAEKTWEIVRTPEGAKSYKYAFESSGGPSKILRAKAESDTAAFLKSVMQDVAVMQRNEKRFLDKVQKQKAIDRQAQQRRAQQAKPPQK